MTTNHTPSREPDDDELATLDMPDDLLDADETASHETPHAPAAPPTTPT